MTWSMAFVLAVVLGTAYLFATERFRLDVSAFAGLTVLLVGGALTVPQALAGFADPTVHMIAALFVVGGAVFHTGLADLTGRFLERRAAGSRTKLLLSIMLTAAGLSAFLSSTGTVAVMLPVVLSLGRRSGVPAAQLLIPLAFATLVGGLLTLIATAPNLVVSGALEQAGYPAFRFFSFTPIGLVALVVTMAFLLTLGGRLLPKGVTTATTPRPRAAELWQRYGLGDVLSDVEITADSPLIGHSIAELEIRSRFSVGVFAVRAHGGRRLEPARAEMRLGLHDTLSIKGSPEHVQTFVEEMLLENKGSPERLPAGLVVSEMLLPPGSAFIGQTVAETRLRSRFDVTVMAVFRSRGVLRESVAQTELFVGDLLLLLGSAKALAKVRDLTRDGITVTETEELTQESFRHERALPTLLVLIGMLVVMAGGWVPAVVATICAALLLVMLGCIEASEASRAISWESVLLIAAVLPMATALTNSGALAWMVDGLVQGLGQASPRVVLATLFLITATIGIVISNTATAVLVAPVATLVAGRLGIRPEPLLMGVAVAASSAFLAPVSSPVNMLVMNAGNYRFGDFAKVGAPLLGLLFVVTVLVVPLFFPFH